MKLTERYISLCRELADLGYLWQPRAGDWMLDITDESIGMLTTKIERPDLVLRVNVHVPYGMQILSLYESRGGRFDPPAPVGAFPDQLPIRCLDRHGALLHEVAALPEGAGVDEEVMAALVEDFRRHGPGAAAAG